MAWNLVNNILYLYVCCKELVLEQRDEYLPFSRQNHTFKALEIRKLFTLFLVTLCKSFHRNCPCYLEKVWKLKGLIMVEVVLLRAFVYRAQLTSMVVTFFPGCKRGWHDGGHHEGGLQCQHGPHGLDVGPFKVSCCGGIYFCPNLFIENILAPFFELFIGLHKSYSWSLSVSWMSYFRSVNYMLTIPSEKLF